MNANPHHHKFEFIDDASDSKYAMEKFIGRFCSGRELHEYIADSGIHGLAFDTEEGTVQVPFIEMPAEHWKAAYRRKRPRP